VVRVQVPATTANLGPGFDTLGLALSLFNQVEMKETGNPGELIIEVEGEGASSIPVDRNNVTYQAAQEVFKAAGYFPAGLHLRLLNRIPSARGLGSSAAARVGGMLAANALLGEPLSKEQLLNMAVRLEGHPDNVAPALFGGLVVASFQDGQVQYRRIEVMDGLTAVLAIPDFELATRAAVEALPALIPVKDAVFNIGQACLLVAGFMTGDWDQVGQAMQDRVHQPFRQSLIPGLNEVLAAARQQGALGAALSGAGPTVLALTAADKRDQLKQAVRQAEKQHQAEELQAERIGQAMQEAFQRHGVKSVILKLKPLNIGARIC
jgi:homoserine kinase